MTYATLSAKAATVRLRIIFCTVKRDGDMRRDVQTKPSISFVFT